MADIFFYILCSSDTDFSSALDFLLVIDDCIQVVKLVEIYINLMEGK